MARKSTQHSFAGHDIFSFHFAINVNSIMACITALERNIKINTVLA
jgi:hypothetical protein